MSAQMYKEREGKAYFKKILALSIQRNKWDKKSILAVMEVLGPWNHNIKLPHNIYTAYVDFYYKAHEEIMRIINHQLGGTFKKKKVVDIGCMEGYFATECALQGSKVLGVEGKLLNVKKCEFTKSVLGLKNLSYVQDDAMKVTKGKYGSFDVVISLGLLYHLNDPFRFLKNMAVLCTDFIVIDTHVAWNGQPKIIRQKHKNWKPELSPIKDYVFEGKTYRGRDYREFDPGTSRLHKDLSATASLKNNFSVWLTEESLVTLLRDVGFEQVQKMVFAPTEELWWADIRTQSRVIMVAVKKRRPFRSKLFGGR